MDTIRKNSPPKTPLVFHVGVTGHRELDPEVNFAITQTITDILITVYQGVVQHAQTQQNILSSIAPLVRCISPLAEGADRIVARQALDLGYELQAPLPFPRAIYEKTFSDDASTQEFRKLLAKTSSALEFDGTLADCDEAYWTVGRVVLEQSDLLIAVWDENKPKGRGGTGQIVEEALHRGVPVFIINPDNPTTVIFRTKCSEDDWRKALDRVLDQILCPYQTSLDKKTDIPQWKHIADCLFGGDPNNTSAQAYFSETWKYPRSLVGKIVAFPSWFEKTLGYQRSAYFYVNSHFSCIKQHILVGKERLAKLCNRANKSNRDEYESDACTWCDGLGLGQPQPRQIEKILTEHYRWADHLAIYYGSLFRALGILRHLLMIVVMLGLVIGFYIDKIMENSNVFTDSIKAFGFFLQFFGFICILFLVRQSRLRGWHQKFLDYRYMAEQFRHIRYLIFLGRVPAITSEGADAACTRESWPVWHLRNVVRQGGLVPLVMVDNSLQVYRLLIDDNIIANQLDFYSNRQQRYGIIARRLELFGMICYVAGIIFIFIRALAFSQFLFNVVALVIPALVSIIFALRSQGEYVRLATRYERMVNILVQKHVELQQISSLTSSNLAEFSEELAGVLSGEVIGWHVSFLGTK